MVRTALLGIFLLALPASAQSTAILGRDDADFARELYTHGWTDLAQGVVTAYEKLEKEGKADPLALLDIQAIGLDIKLDLARRDPDLNNRKKGIAEVIAAKEKLVEDHPRTKVGRDTRDNLPDSYRLLGEALTQALAKETDSDALAQLRTEGEAAFARAESELKQRLDGLRELRLEENQQAADIQYMNALFNLGRTQYFHSRFYPAGDPNAEALLGIAIATFDDLGLDYGDRLLNFEAIYYIGLCHKAMGKPDEALADWDYIVALRENFDVDSKGRYLVIPEVADLVSKAVLQRVLLLTELGRYPEGLAIADEYWNKIIEPEAAASGFAVLSAKAELQIAASDANGAGETAKKLIDLDPQGPWGNKGREIQGRLLGGTGATTMGPAELLRIAQNFYSQGRLEQTLDTAQHVLSAAKGDAKEQDFGSSAMYLMGQVYKRKNWWHEASLVFDTVYERYPKGEATPDALAGAMDCYSKLNAAEKRPFYKSRMTERGQTLVRQFPGHQAAGSVQQAEARGLKDEGKFLEAAQMFRAVPASAPRYAEAQVQAGSCMFLQARALAKDKKVEDAKKLFTEAETILVKAMAEIETAKTKSLDQAVLGSLAQAEYLALTTLAKVYLEDTVGKPKEALATLKGVDERFGTDSDAIEAIWQLRIRALEKSGSIDEAVLKFDELLSKQTDHSGLSGAASVLARSLDQRGLDLSKAERTRAEAERLWRKAVNYYLISVQPQLDNRSNARVAEIEPVAKRLLDLGMEFNGVPEETTNFVLWQPTKPIDRTAWEASANIYDAVIELDPSNYRARIRRARVLGFLQRWKDAATDYASMFESEQLVKAGPDKSSLDANVIKAKPELLDAYLEWGVCEAETGLADKDGSRQARASGIFDLLANGTTQGTALWWNSKYRQVRTLFERGMYEPADVTLRNLERATAIDFADAPPALKSRLISLKTDVEKMVIRKK